MESEMPYLDAIQNIPGNTAKEKYESLNKIIKETAESKKAPGDFAPQTSYGSPIPPSLTPLIQTEIAKILKKTDDLVAALKSEDSSIVCRALRAEWIFDGSNKSVTNFPYFLTHIFPEVSLNTRSNIIKRLSQYLGLRNECSLAQEFFEGISKTYDVDQAMPLLTACSENFISDFIKDGNVYLPKKIVTRLFRKYPELTIRYLKFCKPKSREERVVVSIAIFDYLDLLPRLVKNHVTDFIDIVNSFDKPLYFKLGNKCAELFLKSKGVDALIEFPEKYLPLLSLKLVSRKLNKNQFQLMFRNLFPKDMKNFLMDKMLDYLKFQPEELKVPLITKTFKDVYGVELLLLDASLVFDVINCKFVRMLPQKDRVAFAQKQIAADPDYKPPSWSLSWVCYLSTADSIPQIKEHIRKSKEMEDRLNCVRQLILTCKVNNSVEDLVHVLAYIASNHRNEMSRFWYEVYDTLLEYFDLELLSESHWKIINEMIQRSYVKDNLMDRPCISEKIIEKSIHYNILNHIPIEERMTMLAEVKIRSWNSKFNLFVHDAQLEKLCLEKFIDLIPRKFAEDHEIWGDDNKLDTIHNLTLGLYNYNKRVMEAAKKKQKTLKSEELLSVRNYPWLLEQVTTIILQEAPRKQYKIDHMKAQIKANEPKLYETWFPAKETIARVNEQEGLNLLKKEPEKILKSWKEYLDSCEKNIQYAYTKKFIKKCIWYKDIPIKFTKESLKKVDEGDSRTLMILALLLKGPEFVKVIEPMIPVSQKMEIVGEDAKKSFRVTSSVPPAINVTDPPPPLELVGMFCKGDYLSLGLASLMNVARRTSTKKVITFTKSLLAAPISVRKHGVRLMCVVASTPVLCEFLGGLWKSQTHKSIREVIFQKAHNIFTNHPCKETWLLMSFCIEGLTEEDVECFNVLEKINKVPNEYIKNYFEAGLNKIEKLAKDKKSALLNQLICSFLKNATSEVCAFFPEDYCQCLVQKFAFDFNVNDEVFKAGRLYAVDTFLIEAKDKLESRLKYFCCLLSTAISKHWDEPHPKNFRHYPMKQCFSEIINNIVSAELRIKIDSRIPKAIMDLYPSVLRPDQDPDSYLNLFFLIEFRKADADSRMFGLLVGKQMPNLLKSFTGEMIVYIGESLSNFIIPISNTKSKEGTFIGSLTEALAEVNIIHSSIVAAIMLSKNHTLIPDEQYRGIVEKLRKVNHPAVTSILNKHFVSLDVNETYKK